MRLSSWQKQSRSDHRRKRLLWEVQAEEEEGHSVILIRNAFSVWKCTGFAELGAQGEGQEKKCSSDAA